MKAIVLTIFGALTSASLQAAGFNCDQAQTQVERMVCAHDLSSELDSEMARVYASSKNAASPHQARRIGVEQSAWLKNVRARCSDLQCLIIAYVSRIDELSKSNAIASKPATKTDSTIGSAQQRALTQSCIEKARLIPEDVDDTGGDVRYELQEVSTACSEAIAVNPTNEKAYLYRGLANAALHNDVGAIEDFTKAIELDPRDPQPYFRRGEQYARYDNDFLIVAKVITDQTRAISLSPTLTKAYLLRGEAYQNVALRTRYGLYDRVLAEYAIADLSKVIEAEPTNEHAIWNRGFSYSMAGNYRQAVKDYSTLIGLRPSDGSIYHDRGRALANLGLRDEAIADFTKAIALNPKHSNPREARGELYLQGGEFQLAIDDFTVALALFPEGYVVYYSRGIAYNSLGDKERAVADWRMGASKGDTRARDILQSRVQ